MFRRKKSSNKLPPFVPLIWDLLNSKAFKDLKHAAAKALPYFLGKYKGAYHDPQRYLHEFPFPYSEGKRLGFSFSTFHRVIEELVRKGFIDPVDKGGLRSHGKSYNLFKLSKRWEKYGTTDFESSEWRCFLPRIRTTATSEKETYSFKKGNKDGSESKDISQTEAVAAN